MSRRENPAAWLARASRRGTVRVAAALTDLASRSPATPAPEHHTLAGAYACDALSAAEAATFERHLTTCQVCREEIEEFAETAAVLGACAALPPPPRLRTAVGIRIEGTAQLPRVRLLRRWRRLHWSATGHSEATQTPARRGEKPDRGCDAGLAQ
jgi:hypothetical protein